MIPVVLPDIRVLQSPKKTEIFCGINCAVPLHSWQRKEYIGFIPAEPEDLTVWQQMAVLEMKAYFPQIQLYLALRLIRNRYEQWPQREIALFEQIAEHADKVEIISPVYTEDCMKQRNYYMVDHSCVLRLLYGTFGTKRNRADGSLCQKEKYPFNRPDRRLKRRISSPKRKKRSFPVSSRFTLRENMVVRNFLRKIKTDAVLDSICFTRRKYLLTGKQTPA